MFPLRAGGVLVGPGTHHVVVTGGRTYIDGHRVIPLMLAADPNPFPRLRLFRWCRLWC